MSSENSYVLIDGELYHYGVLGMKWGIRRSRDKLVGRVGKLGSKNKELSDEAARLDSLASTYGAKGAALAKRNSKYESRLTKATAKSAKYEVKLAKQLKKANPNADKVAKYSSKKAKYDLKIAKAQRKIKYNKWTVKSEEAKAAATAAREKIKKNTKLMNTFNKTISAMDAGTIQQGRFFMQYVTE